MCPFGLTKRLLCEWSCSRRAGVMSSRRIFLAQMGVGAASFAASPDAPLTGANSEAVDFRYRPLDGQAVFCFPDDTYKSLVGASGELRYGHPGTNVNLDAFSSVVRFSLAGMEPDRV